MQGAEGDGKLGFRQQPQPEEAKPGHSPPKSQQPRSHLPWMQLPVVMRYPREHPSPTGGRGSLKEGKPQNSQAAFPALWDVIPSSQVLLFPPAHEPSASPLAWGGWHGADTCCWPSSGEMFWSVHKPRAGQQGSAPGWFFCGQAEDITYRKE